MSPLRDRLTQTELLQLSEEAAKKSPHAEQFNTPAKATMIAEWIWKLKTGYLPDPKVVNPIRDSDEKDRKYFWWAAKNIPLEVLNQADATTHDAKDRGELQNPIGYFMGVVEKMMAEQGTEEK